MKSIAIVDYGMGNIRSLAKALERAGASSVVRASDPDAVRSAERLVIPGQGAFGQAMGRLHERTIAEPLVEAIEEGRPVLGVCLGLQILFETSEEAPGVRGLGVCPGTVSLMPLAPGLKRPHMGWAPVAHASAHPVLAANPSGEAFYFVHSYAAVTAPKRWSVAHTEHGHRFLAAIACDNLVATQFHPEKSQDAGARLLEAFLGL